MVRNIFFRVDYNDPHDEYDSKLHRIKTTERFQNEGTHSLQENKTQSGINTFIYNGG